MILAAVHGQARHLRHHPLRPQPVPPGRRRPGPAAADPGRDRDPLRRRRGLRPARPEAAGRLLLARRTSASSCSAPSRSPPQGLSGGVLQMVNHGLVTAALFLLIGWIYERRRTWQVVELRGLQSPAPVLAAVFTVVMMAVDRAARAQRLRRASSSSWPGTFLTHRWWAVVATAGVVLAALYLLWAYQQAFHHEPDEANRPSPGPGVERAPRDRPAHRAHRGPRRLPEAGARPDHPVGHPPGRTTSTHATHRRQPAGAWRRAPRHRPLATAGQVARAITRSGWTEFRTRRRRRRRPPVARRPSSRSAPRPRHAPEPSATWRSCPVIVMLGGAVARPGGVVARAPRRCGWPWPPGSSCVMRAGRARRCRSCSGSTSPTTGPHVSIDDAVVDGRLQRAHRGPGVVRHVPLRARRRRVWTREGERGPRVPRPGPGLGVGRHDHGRGQRPRSSSSSGSRSCRSPSTCWPP